MCSAEVWEAFFSGIVTGILVLLLIYLFTVD